MAADAADPGVPISGHEVKRALLHTRHDMVLVTTLLVTLNQQAESIDRKARTIIRVLWLLAVILIIIAIG